MANNNLKVGPLAMGAYLMNERANRKNDREIAAAQMQQQQEIAELNAQIEALKMAQAAGVAPEQLVDNDDTPVIEAEPVRAELPKAAPAQNTVTPLPDTSLIASIEDIAEGDPNLPLSVKILGAIGLFLSFIGGVPIVLGLIMGDLDTAYSCVGTFVIGVIALLIAAAMNPRRANRPRK